MLPKSCCHHWPDPDGLDVAVSSVDELDAEQLASIRDAMITTPTIGNKRDLHMGVTHSSSPACIWLPLNIYTITNAKVSHHWQLIRPKLSGKFESPMLVIDISKKKWLNQAISEGSKFGGG